MPEETKKICFVVTPIGNSDSAIRRHMEGIIDQSITPALENKYIVEVAHRKYEIGSINDRVINSIYSADLVVANLTSLNPNVMFELAIRYSFGKPAIVIAERGTQLPFDIVDENTIFYDNDPTGAHILKEELVKFENNIEYGNKMYGPVYKAISSVALYKDIESGKEVSSEKLLRFIIDKLDVLENDYRHKSIKASPKYLGVEILVMSEGANISDVDTTIDYFVDKNRDIIAGANRIEKGVRFQFRSPMLVKEIDEIIRQYSDVLKSYNIEMYMVTFLYPR